MPTLQERHRVKDLKAQKRDLTPERAGLIDRLIELGVLEDKALRAVKERGLTAKQVDDNIAAGRPPHFVEYQDPDLLEKMGCTQAATAVRESLKKQRQ